MAIITGTYQSTSGASKQNREIILRDTIERVDPSETPLFSMIPRGPNVDGVDPKWVQSSLATPDPDNAQVEGDTYTFTAVNQPARVGNYTQIFWRTFAVSDSQNELLKVGPKTEVGRNRMEKGLEIRTDIEASMLSNNASVAGLTRKSAGLRAWTATNDVFSAGGASGGFNSGTGLVTTATNGTAQRAFSKSLMDAALLATYTAGGNPTLCILSPYAKSVFSGFMSDASVAQLRVPISAKSQATIVGAADAYLSDWGLIDFVPDRQMARVGAALARNVYFITPDKLEKGFFRDIQEDTDLASNADAELFVLKCEFALINRHEKAHGVVADVFGMTTST